MAPRPARIHDATGSPPDELKALRAEVGRLKRRLEKVTAEKKVLEALAREDPLTGLLNRRGFERDLVKALAYAGRYGADAALLICDLDAFKPINDRFGHEAGDAALRHVAALLRAHLRASDSIGRLGGDEFAVLLWQVDLAKARAKADTLAALLQAEPLTWEGETIRISASIGVAVLRPDEDAARLLARADRDMYACKATHHAAEACPTAPGSAPTAGQPLRR